MENPGHSNDNNDTSDEIKQSEWEIEVSNKHIQDWIEATPLHSLAVDDTESVHSESSSLVATTFPRTLTDFRPDSYRMTVFQPYKFFEFKNGAYKLHVAIGTLRLLLAKNDGQLNYLEVHVETSDDVKEPTNKLQECLTENNISFEFSPESKYIRLPICTWDTIFKISGFVVGGDLMISGGGMFTFG